MTSSGSQNILGEFLAYIRMVKFDDMGDFNSLLLDKQRG